MRSKIVIGLIVIVVLAFGAWLTFGRQTNQDPRLDTSYASNLLQKFNSDPAIQPSRVAEGQLPPTNRWYSGAFIGPAVQPIYPLPLAFKPSTDGFGFNAPSPTVSANTIFGSYVADINLKVPNATTMRLDRQDAISITIGYYNNQNQLLGSATLAQGSPYIFYKANSGQSVSLNTDWRASTNASYTTVVGKHRYGFVTTGKFAGQAVALDKNQTITMYAHATGLSDTDMAQSAKSYVQNVETTYGSNRATATTTLRYNTVNGETLYAAMPHQQMLSGSKTNGYYDTIYGRLNVYRGNQFSFTVPTVQPDTVLSVDKFSDTDRQRLIDQLKIDAAATKLDGVDTYNGGKQLYRAAQLYQLAMQLNQKEIADQLYGQLDSRFAEWFDPNGYKKRSDRYFYYDTTLKGVVGAQAAYGSDQFNDHHFHYGYFLNAVSIVATYHPQTASKYGSMVNLLAADIANTQTDKYFPKQRVFDAYTGHSWASGNGQFADGNNQESSSEAISAWNGLANWAKVSKQPELQKQAAWMLSNEASSAKEYWTTIDTNNNSFKGYTHPIMALNWGGKRDYATFFSDSPNAKLGIQLLPMSPVFAEIYKNNSSITSNLATTNMTDQFSDYLLLYGSLKQGATTNPNAILSMPNSAIDSANSKSYSLAFLMTQN